jgi:hypothetical protein
MSPAYANAAVQTINAAAVVLNCDMMGAVPDVGACVGVAEGAEVALGALEGADVELVGAAVPADTVKVIIRPCSQCADTSHANTSSPTSAPEKVCVAPVESPTRILPVSSQSLVGCTYTLWKPEDQLKVTVSPTAAVIGGSAAELGMIQSTEMSAPDDGVASRRAMPKRRHGRIEKTL